MRQLGDGFEVVLADRPERIVFVARSDYENAHLAVRSSGAERRSGRNGAWVDRMDAVRNMIVGPPLFLVMVSIGPKPHMVAAFEQSHCESEI